jgi:TusA-related sulfurtransferase
MTVGQLLKVVADDPAAESDISVLVKRTGQELVELRKEDGSVQFLIRKRK